MSAVTPQRPVIGNSSYHSADMTEATQVVDQIARNLSDFRQELAMHSLMLQRFTHSAKTDLASLRSSSVQPNHSFPLVKKLDQLSSLVRQNYEAANAVRVDAQSRLMKKQFEVDSAFNHKHATPDSSPIPQ